MWTIVDDKNTRQNWECPDCGADTVVYPIEYEDIGTPVCVDCDCDMVYNYTEVNNA